MIIINLITIINNNNLNNNIDCYNNNEDKNTTNTNFKYNNCWFERLNNRLDTFMITTFE